LPFEKVMLQVNTIATAAVPEKDTLPTAQPPVRQQSQKEKQAYLHFTLISDKILRGMAEVILMPRLSDTMTEGVIAAWHKKVGDPVKKGELLAEIETDKATMELESYKDGTLLHVGAGDGGKLQVNDLLAIIGQQGEDISAHLAGGTANGAAAPEAKPKPKNKTQPPHQNKNRRPLRQRRQVVPISAKWKKWC
jgi:pyruvate/2-oxoglutarate dehydrogenase complex dihydrolipoamide acyltransferase (E2) component